MRRRFFPLLALVCILALLVGCAPQIPPAADPAPPPPQEETPAPEIAPEEVLPPTPAPAPENESTVESEAEAEAETEAEPAPETAPEPIPEPAPEYKPRTLTTLMYHDFMEGGVPPTDWVITTEMFREDLQWLKDNGYTTVLPRELAMGQLDNGEALPEKMVMLTFDDGYTSNYTLAMPLLAEYGAKAVVALIGSHIDSGEPGFLTWEQCREMNESGLFEFGSHTYDHHIREGINGIARLSGETQDAYTDRIRSDIAQSVTTIETELGSPVTYFAYPLGKVDSWANGILAEFFTVTATSNLGKADINNGLYRLPRYNVTARERAAAFVR